MKKLYFFTTSRCSTFLLLLTLLFSAAAHSQEFMRANLYVDDANSMVLMDGNMTNYGTNYSNHVDINDAFKFANPGVNFGILRENYNLVVERRSLVVSSDTTFFRMWNMPQHNYKIMFVLAHLDHPGLKGFLKDNYLHTETRIDMNDTTWFSFSVNADAGSSAESRFQFIYTTASTTMNEVAFTGIKTVKENGGVMLQWQVEDEMNVQFYTIQYSMDGTSFNNIRQIAANNSGGSGSYNYNYEGSLNSSNYFRVKASLKDGKIKYSDKATLSIAGISSDMKVCSNPVTDQMLRLQFKNIPAGNYTMILVSATGLKKKIGILKLDENETNRSVVIPQGLAQGVYNIQLTGSNKISIVKTILIL